MRWREVRAGAIALVIALALVEGCPLPRPGEERPWQRAYVSALRPVQRAVLAPFAAVPRQLRFSQRWALFQVGPRDRYRLEVHGRAAHGWVLLYRAGDPGHRAYASLLERRRVVGVWNPTDRVSGRYPHFASWLATRVLTDRPDLDAVRIRQERIAVEEGALVPTGAHVFVETRYRAGAAR